MSTLDDKGQCPGSDHATCY